MQGSRRLLLGIGAQCAELLKETCSFGTRKRNETGVYNPPCSLCIAAGSVPLCVAEEENLVLLDRPAHGTTELVANISWLRFAAAVIEKRIRSELRNAVVLISRPVETIRSVLRRHVHDCARSAPVFRSEVVCQHAHFLHRIQRNRLTNRGRELVVVRGTIEKNVCGCRP